MDAHLRMHVLAQEPHVCHLTKYHSIACRPLQVVDPDPAEQQEWLWTCNNAEQSDAKHAIVPQLRMVVPTSDGGTRRLLASNVLVFRIDSFEGDFVGQAILIRDWQVLPDLAAV